MAGTVRYPRAMEISDNNLNKFRAWMIGRGRVDGTVDLYVSNIRSCGRDTNGITHRLVAGKLSPNSLRTNIAALRAWAAFTKDVDLVSTLNDIRLPPPRRVRVKLPLEVKEWRQVVRHLQTCQMPSDAMRQVLLIVAIRGFRSGDVLRLRRLDVLRALDTGKLTYEGKGRKRMTFAAEPIRQQLQALADIPGWTRVADLVSTSKIHRVISKKVCRAAQRAAKTVGVLEMNPHRFRHTFATRYLDELKGDPNAIVKLQKYMGWESMATAARYVDQVSQDQLDEIGAGLISGLLE
jgi:integrase